MSDPDTYLLPRLYETGDLTKGALMRLTPAQERHLLGALRVREGRQCRVFNGREGEWLATVEGKALRIHKLLRPQPTPAPAPTLLFAPIKKERCSVLIEKAVELGAGVLVPVRTARTQGQAIAALAPDKLLARTIGAAEQAERLILPTLYPLESLKAAVERLSCGPGNLYVCLERAEGAGAPYIGDITFTCPCAFLIGPEGGFDAAERTYLEGLTKSAPLVKPLWLGPEILRCETVAAFILSAVKLHTQPICG